MSFSRRSFLRLPLALSILPSIAVDSDVHTFSYDHVIGTSLDLVIRARDAKTARRAHQVLLDEVHRLTCLLDTRDPHSEISRLERDPAIDVSGDLRQLLAAYDEWQRRTGGAIAIRPRGRGTPRDVDALGKAYIIDRALAAARTAVPEMTGAMLNIGGDLLAWGRPADIGILDPQLPYDNGTPLTQVRLRNAAIATSGSYARGRHLLDPRSGRPVAQAPPSASVIAPDAITANALATAIAVSGVERGLQLVEQLASAHAIVTDPSGRTHRSSGFAAFERGQELFDVRQGSGGLAMVRSATSAGPGVSAALQSASKWPDGYQVTLSLTLTQTANAIATNRRGAALRPYVAVWVENTAAKIVRVLAVWATEPRYLTELPVFFTRAKRNRDYVMSLSRATRPPGHYDLVWDGRDQDGMPVEPGTYKITVEANRENGGYGKQSSPLVCGDAPAKLTLPATINFEPVAIEYGPRTTA
jgi:thiamine biosynthesis lipoprotein